QSVDQRLKIPRWMAEFQKRGGNLQIEAADIDDLESCARGHDLVIVASGKGTIAQLFERDTSRSPFSEPQRSLALTYVRKMRPREPYAAVCFNLIPNIGERSEEHTSELQSRSDLVCRLLLEKKN